MTEENKELLNVVILLGSAVLAVPIFKKIGLGAVLGYLAAGLIVGPYGLQLFDNTKGIIHLAELGIVMFLFVIGLEMKTAQLWQLRKQIFGIGSAQAILIATTLTTIGVILKLPWQVAFVAAAGFVLSSTAIITQILKEKRELTTPKGQKVVSILLFEDLLIVPLLAIVAFLAPTDPNMMANRQPIWQQLAAAITSLAILITAGTWLLNPLFKTLAKSNAREVMTAAALFVVLGAAILMEWGGISMAMGAFIAGVLLSESSFRHQLETDIEPFRGLLLGLFFLGVGMSLNIHTVIDNWQIITIGTIIAITTKSTIVYTVAKISKTNKTEATERAFIMSQGGEFAFVLYTAAASQGVIDKITQANLAAIIVISMAITPILMIIHRKAFNKKNINLDGVNHITNTQNTHGNVLIIGFGRMGQIASQLPLLYGAKITIIDNNPDTIRTAEKYNLKVYYGDGSRQDVLRTAGAYNADCVMICIDNPNTTTQIVKNIKKYSKNTKTIARAKNHKHAIELIHAEIDHFVRETFEAAIDMGSKTLKAMNVNQEDIEKYSTHIRNTDKQKFTINTQENDFLACEQILKNTEPKK